MDQGQESCRGTLEMTGDTAPVCDRCGRVGWGKRDGDPCDTEATQ